MDLLSASYYAAEFPYSQFDGFDPDRDEDIVLHLVSKTRGGQQYYQRRATMAWDVSHSDVLKDLDRLMCNSSHEITLEEAQGRNRSLSVQRKAYATAVVLVLAILLEGIVGVDISILSSGSPEVNVIVPETEIPATDPD